MNTTVLLEGGLPERLYVGGTEGMRVVREGGEDTTVEITD